MITTSIYLDTRRVDKRGLSRINIVIRQGRTTSFIATDFKVAGSDWDSASEQVINVRNAKIINAALKVKLMDIEQCITRLSIQRELDNFSAKEIKAMIQEAMNPTAAQKHDDRRLFTYRFARYRNMLKSEGTRDVYTRTMDKIREFDPNIDKKHFEDLNFGWLREFDEFLAKTHSVNGRSILLRCIRAVFNDAIDDEITTAYPFRKFKIKYEKTRKRSLKLDKLRTFVQYKCDEWQREYLDIFNLCFMLRGINMVDLCGLRPENLVDGRIEYDRAKTHKHYSVKVEPEAMKIIKKYRGKDYLLKICDRYPDYHTYVHNLNDALKRVGLHVDIFGRAATGEALCPQISQYWCRHSWATAAAELDIPKEVIAHGLGHGSDDVTDIYIDFNMDKVDAANRIIIDAVFNTPASGNSKKKL